MRQATRLPALLLLFAPCLGAQGFDAPGPLTSGFRNVPWPSSFGIALGARIYYPSTASGAGAPADPSQGPFPLVGMIHGQSFAPSSYDELSLHIASWGYVVASIGPLAGGFHTHAGTLTAELLNWVDGESGSPASFLSGMVSDDPWSAMGHSLGGGALERLIPAEPKVRAIVPLQPAFLASGAQDLGTFEGAVMVVTGSVDTIVPPSQDGIPYFEAASPNGRNLYEEVQGMSHFGPLDNPPPAGEPLPHTEQMRLHKKLVVAFLQGEIRGLENAYLDLLGEGLLSEPVLRRSHSELPPLWALESAVTPGDLLVGIGGRKQERVLLALSLHPAAIPTPLGILGLDPGSTVIFLDGTLGDEGWTEARLAIPTGFTGTVVHLQGLALHPGGALLSRSAQFVLP